MSRSKLPPHVFDEAQLREFLNHVLDPEIGCAELRVFRAAWHRNFVVAAQQYSSTLAGWYDNIDSFVADAATLRGVSGYITVNPVNRDLLARSYNRLTRNYHTTKDDDIVCLRWLYIDFDPVRLPDISATDEELAAAIDRRDHFLKCEPTFRRSGIWGASGNGAWCWVRLPDYPADAEHRAMIGRALDVLSDRYSDDRVTVDVKTKNPARVAALPGTQKCKGSDMPDRPFRLATFTGKGN